jgi:hypothetical protein
MASMKSILAFAIVACASAPALAQEMGQGEARITSRSDVRLSMESMPGTSGAAVSMLGQRVGSRMAQIRGCYEERIEQDPTVTGTLRLRFLLEARGAPRIEVDNDGVGDREVLRCIERVLEGIPAPQLTRPTRAIVQLVLANTAARGAERAAERAEQAQQVELTNDPQGNPTSRGGTPDGRVVFTLTGRGAGGGPAVTAAHRALLTALPGLMDCRRRAGRRGRSPAGDLGGWMQIATGRAPTARVTRSTVPNERTQSCVGRVLDRIEYRPTEGRGRVELSIHFEEATPVESREEFDD